MPMTMKQKTVRAARRAHRVRTRMQGTATSPRLTVKRSSKHLYAQLIDDVAGRTLAAVSDKEASAEGGKGMKPIDLAREAGKILAQKAGKAGIASAVFDRGSYRYHGRVAALADGAREGGLTF